MTRFSKMDPRGVETQVREISSTDIRRCPHLIFHVDHYREDGSCRCNDESATVMAEWGYVWRDGQWRSPEQ